MEIFSESYKQGKDLHHAHIIEGEKDYVLSQIVNFLEKDLAYNTKNNPDFRIEHFKTFGIEEARSLSEVQLGRSFNKGRKIFIVSFDAITTEAQNAMLKVIEEPTLDTHFFIITNSASTLLPTLLSRVFFLKVKPMKERKKINFLSLNIKDRLERIEEIAEEKDKTEARKLLHSIEDELSVHFKNGSLEAREALLYLYEALSYLNDRSSSIKMILEHVAHVMPMIK